MKNSNSQRDQYSDSLKFILIQLVVIGHFTLELFDHPIARAITNAIYSFHMPVFIFLSGYFSKNTAHHRKDVTKLLFTFFIFQAAWVAYNISTSFGYFQKNPFVPTHQNWYLLALFTWRLFVPYASLFKRPHVILVSILLAFAVGVTDSFGHFLSLHRTIYFFPIFLFGYYCSDLTELLHRFEKYRIIAVIAFAAILFIVFISSYYEKAIASMVFLGYVPRLGHQMDLQVLIARLLGFLSSIIIGTFFLIIVPKRLPAVFNLGRNSVNPFLLHMFYVYPFAYLVKNFDSMILAICSFPVLIIITTIISLDRFNVLMKPLTDLDHLTSLRLFNRNQKSIRRR